MSGKPGGIGAPSAPCRGGSAAASVAAAAAAADESEAVEQEVVARRAAVIGLLQTHLWRIRAAGGQLSVGPDR